MFLIKINQNLCLKKNNINIKQLTVTQRQYFPVLALVLSANKFIRLSVLLLWDGFSDPDSAEGELLAIQYDIGLVDF